MKKIGIVLIVIVIYFIWQGIDIYHHLTTVKNQKTQTAISQAKKDFPIQKVLSTYEYRGENSYEVINATLTNNRKLWIWMPETKTGIVPVTARASDGYTKNEIEKAFKAKVPYKRLLSVKLGLINQGDPIWEIDYVDASGAFVFSYYDFYTGKSVRQPIALKNT